MSTSTRGLASQTPERRKEIAAMGGRTGKGYRWTPEDASKAGAKGGKKSKRPATSYNKRVPEGEQLV